ncbi:hypothetical protein GCM10020358_78180 [Amorphoplanes nipponensis]|uniref:Uncharacterized protein n=1 Tax=Actinoplanes nipponensis TaxID=135950 RepID=A0A919MPM8_9ACTN|nr:hypothetical protein [Actinoplanes nipponensis]GIE52761.1 hypothetical protein Ani05nite_62950 [Actinoplanes nipponensis]
MNSTDNNDADLFLAPAGSAAPEDKSEAADNSAAAMTRLRDPFAVEGAEPAQRGERQATAEAH